METDVIGQEILAKVLMMTGYSRGVLASDRSPRNVAARERIYALMRSCEHPECPQLSLRRIAQLCHADVANIRTRIRKHGQLEPWKFQA